MYRPVIAALRENDVLHCFSRKNHILTYIFFHFEDDIFHFIKQFVVVISRISYRQQNEFEGTCVN